MLLIFIYESTQNSKQSAQTTIERANMARGQRQRGGRGRGRGRGQASNKLSSSSLSSSSNYNPTTPFIVRIPQQTVTKPMVRDEAEMCVKTTFGPFHKDETIDATYMCHYYFPDHLIKKWTKCTNKYACDNCDKRKIKEVKEQHILQFLAVYYYMGVVRLPAKRDYWKQGGMWPVHPVMKGMSRDMFEFLFRYFHVSYDGKGGCDEFVNDDEHDSDLDEEEEDVNNDNNDNNNDNEMSGNESGNDGEEGEEGDPDDDPDVYNRASEEFAQNTIADEDDDVEVEEENNAEGLAPEIIVSVWYDKVEEWIEFVNENSKKIVDDLSDILSIDEMMKLFKGRHHQTHVMKQKPIKKGFKFWACSCPITGFVYRFVPSGRMEKEKIFDIVMDMAKSLPGMDEREETEDTNYVFVMDNYFTLPKVVGETGLRGVGVACVGTARARQGWPPKPIADVDDKRFNTLYHYDDPNGFRIFRWVDNNVVTMVSTMHSGEEVIERKRRKPRENKHNKSFLPLVFGERAIARVEIPGVIDFYNHKMKGVDLSDQLNANYRPKLRVRRYWFAMWEHGADVARVNSYVVTRASKTIPDTRSNQKQFMMEWVDAFHGRACALRYGRTRRAVAISSSLVKHHGRARSRTSHTNPTLPVKRFKGHPAEHKISTCSTKLQRRCVLCSYKQMKAKIDGAEQLPHVVITRRICSFCDVNLCDNCFPEYHQR